MNEIDKASQSGLLKEFGNFIWKNKVKLGVISTLLLGSLANVGVAKASEVVEPPPPQSGWQIQEEYDKVIRSEEFYPLLQCLTDPVCFTTTGPTY